MADGLDVRLGEQADELYALPPEDFVAARDAKAKGLRADGQRDLAQEVAALPRPTVAAWLLNQLARRRTAAVGQLVDLGAELRVAQDSLDGEQLRALTRQRHQVVRAFSRQVADLGTELGRPVSGTVAGQVEETLRAAVADEEAGQALLSGRLATALSYVGMGQGSASARPGPTTSGRKRPAGTVAGPGRAAAGRQGARGRESAGSRGADGDRDEVAVARKRRREEARAAVETAEKAAAAAVSTLEKRDKQLSRVAERMSALQDRLQALRAELTQVEAEVADAEEKQDELRASRDQAEQAARDARSAVARARGDVDDVDDQDDVADVEER
ncbi:MAG TPA: hypothetical protein VK365_04690 [Nocardioidaceae bacterium]|nr:hypothetical protein [Nocardioidaceae bacterium]